MQRMTILTLSVALSIWTWMGMSCMGQTVLRQRETEVSIRGDAFSINGRPTYEGRTWHGKKVEGLLFNSRMVQGIFDDRNPETRRQWAYPDTGAWDAERNTREFIAAMPEWRRHGLLAITLNLQGGNPRGYGKDQPWHNSAITPDGELRPDSMARLESILDRADELGMVVILGIFYFGQDQRLTDEAAVVRGLDNAVDWVLDRDYRNVLIEVNNECDVRYDHAILKPDRVHELIERVKARQRDGRRLLASTSYGGKSLPRENVVRTADFLLLHGNSISNPDGIAALVRQTRRVPGYRPMPILFNEDDHFEFGQPRNNLLAALGEYASWGYFDFRMAGEGFDDGYQSVPVNWGISSPRKKAFFAKLAEITGPAAADAMAFPGKDWERATPASRQIDAEKLAAAIEYLRRNAPRDGVRELVIVRNGRLVWAGDNIDHRHGVWSATKSFTSTVLGLLIDDGKCSLDTRGREFVPDLAGTYPQVTLRHFATMTSGYRADGDEPQGGYTHGPSRTPFRPSTEPLFTPPGGKYAYWDSAMNMFGLVLTRIAGEPMEQLFQRRIADRIGMNPEQWDWGDYATIDGVVVNGGSGNGNKHMLISAGEMARLGHLFLNRGNWNGQQLLSASCVDMATKTQIPASTPLGDVKLSPIHGPGVYGFNWWTNGVKADGRRKWPGAPASTFAASGHNNNDMFVIPDWNMVVVRLGLDQEGSGGFAITDETYGTFLQMVGEAIEVKSAP